MPYFKYGNALRIQGEKIVVLNVIASGEQADVYRVLNVDRGQYMALKHLYGNYASDKFLFYRKVCILCKNRHNPIHPDLVWPVAVSQFDAQTESFCYLMEYLSEKYKPVAYLMKNPESISFEQRKKIAIRLAEIFMALHQDKYIYSDVSQNNIQYWIEDCGEVHVKLIDCDNISINGQSLGLVGTGLFRAPEILCGRATPTVESDIHALAVAVFRMLVGSHPLDGQLTHEHPFTPENIVHFFGKEPVFIFAGSGQNPPCHAVYWERFQRLDRGLQLYFHLMFSPGCLSRTRPRPLVSLLRDALIRCK